MQGRGLGFFGDDNDRVKQQKEQRDADDKIKVKEACLKTNEVGRATLQSVPIGFYTIEVAGNEEFQPSRREVNIINDEDKDELFVFIGMKPRVDSTIEFVLLSQNETKHTEKLSSKGTQIKAILLPSESPQKHGRDDETFEFEILYDREKDKWSSELPNGSYLVNVIAQGHSETNQYVEIKSGSRRSFEVYCLQKTASTVKVQIQAVNIANGKKLKNVFITIAKSNS